MEISYVRVIKADGASSVNREEKLKTLLDALKSTKFTQPVPDESQLKILRRGSLTCKSDSGCSFVLTLPSEVKAID